VLCEPQSWLGFFIGIFMSKDVYLDLNLVVQAFAKLAKAQGYYVGTTENRENCSYIILFVDLLTG